MARKQFNDEYRTLYLYDGPEDNPKLISVEIVNRDNIILKSISRRTLKRIERVHKKQMEAGLLHG
jgi:hypothetical protein